MEVYDFGLRLKELREAKKLSQTDVAARLNVVPSTISGYESNTITPSLEQFTRLAILYNTSLDYMMGLDNRVCFYLDGLSGEDQQTILDVVNRLKQSFLSRKK
ncbi:helix-turn-helix domain-containing protein [uncultured Oscillibacter sp.]|uniref:helix-turn-helix domain-containing protein n=1 Tax=uncultured Oscillibacter sp. TaxID=876091 RepID=UPI00272CF7AE|nr:helix-turn-helix transcriptional regulator [uncultured Oscillibacter sp.]